MAWVACLDAGTQPEVTVVTQVYFSKSKQFSYRDFRIWYDLKQKKTTFVPSVWYCGHKGWVEIHGVYGKTITFGSVTVSVSTVCEGHGIFKADNIQPGEYGEFTVLANVSPLLTTIESAFEDNFDL
tara:strand:- start:27 stop:404 length:378 start_codon:yes stop_codon:yes gene_type:complete